MSNLYNGTVVTSRVRLARNLSGYNFASTLKDQASAREIINKTYGLITRFGEFDLYEMARVSEDFAYCLKEKYVISENLRKNTFSGAVAVDKQECLSVMINEEDHVREQCILKGEDLLLAYSKLQPLDRWLNNNLRFCKTEKYGYITACPTNLGTGLRASVMMFLPTITQLGLIKDLCENAKPRGLTVRGVFGEGSSSQTCLYQVSNEVTLGKKETDIIQAVKNYVAEISDIEKLNAMTFYNKNKLEVQDKCFRALALLTGSKILSYEEFSYLMANLKWGVMLGLIKVKSPLVLDDLIVKVRPHILKSYITLESADNRAIQGFFSENRITETDSRAIDAYRAEYVKNSIKKIL